MKTAVITNLVEEIALIESALAAVAETPVLEDLPKPMAEAFSTPKASRSLATENPHAGNNLSKPMVNSNNNSNVSHSFLQNLVGFLRNKL